MSDLISRSKIYNYIKTEINPYGKPFEGTAYELGLKLMEYIKQMDDSPAVTDINVGSKWIPCSEKLPEIKGWYHCTCNDDEVWGKPIVRDLYYYPGLKAFVDNIRYEMNGLKDIQKYNWSKYVTAWMPLPEPYKGE